MSDQQVRAALDLIETRLEYLRAEIATDISLEGLSRLDAVLGECRVAQAALAREAQPAATPRLFNADDVKNLLMKCYQEEPDRWLRLPPYELADELNKLVAAQPDLASLQSRVKELEEMLNGLIMRWHGQDDMEGGDCPNVEMCCHGMCANELETLLEAALRGEVEKGAA